MTMIFITFVYSVDDDMTHVNKNLSKKQRNIWYEARLLSGNGDNGEKAKKVYVYISPKVSENGAVVFLVDKVGIKATNSFYFLGGFKIKMENPCFLQEVIKGSSP